MWFSALAKTPRRRADSRSFPLFLLPLLGYLWKPLGMYGPYGAVAAGTASLGGLAGPAVAVPASAWVSAGLDVVLAVRWSSPRTRALRRTEL